MGTDVEPSGNEENRTDETAGGELGAEAQPPSAGTVEPSVADQTATSEGAEVVRSSDASIAGDTPASLDALIDLAVRNLSGD